ncbi:hypothetical protein NLU13_3227 [Sarocladium strictum]|uniref:U three protein 23 n=1 Tax=Sarocladium strictum TaxID=5046 RepID=A0AA39GPB8_SARSR|nr:hypothetical protein NLU13_3227 [Sarocladium strictum]
MRGKRSKQYRKLMVQYSMTFGFREPYQVLVDAEMVRDACRFKMDLAASLERTVHGKVKPLITQCEIRKLYAQKSEPGTSEAIDCAKTFERRRCGHHPDEYPEPLSTKECLHSVVDPKDSATNKHRYVVASQSQEVRRMLRGVKGVPLIYIKRSVMILEPMADESVMVRAREERSKFRAELKSTSSLGKRARDEDEDAEKDGGDDGEGENPKKKKKRAPGPKGPNPLAVKKPKKKAQQQKPQQQDDSKSKPTTEQPPAEQEAEEPAKKKRRRRKAKATAEPGEPEPAKAGRGDVVAEGDDS